MNIDWDRVKKETLWSYEDLIKKLKDALSYRFVQEYYNHTLEQARDYAGRICQGYLQNRGDMAAYIHSTASHLEMLEICWAGNYTELVRQVGTREQCAAFLQRTGFDFEALIQVLNYLMRWVLPFRSPIREFLEGENAIELSYLEALKKEKIGSNLDLLETGRTPVGRARLASTAEIPEAFITDLVHKADISRLAYVRGKTARHLCAGGYDTLERIASADLAEMEAKMDAYYRTLGKSLADFKSVIPLAWMIGGARILPRVVEA